MAIALPKPAASEATNALRQHMTFEEFLAWDGDGNPLLHAEWVDGEAVPMVSVNERHSVIGMFLKVLLSIACRRNATGRVFDDPFVMRAEAGGNGRSPDLMVVRTENYRYIAENYLNGPADIVVEIVSPGSIKTDYVVKAGEYAHARIPEYWIIDPLENTVTFMILSERGQYAESALNDVGQYESPGLNGLSINPEWFNQDPLPDELDILREWGIIPPA